MLDKSIKSFEWVFKDHTYRYASMFPLKMIFLL